MQQKLRRNNLLMGTRMNERKPLAKPPTKMTPNEKAISLVLNILLFIGIVVVLLYGGAIADWMNSLG